MTTHDTPNPGRSVTAGIFLISAAALLLQVTLTRIFSVAIWYHFAFLVVSVALFGFGASGTFLALRQRHALSPEHLPWTAGGFGLSALVAYVGTNAIPFEPFRIAAEPVQLAYFLAVDILLTLPFFFAGLTVALILRLWPVHAGRLYAWDLVGAALGSLLVFATLPLAGARGAVAVAAMLGFASAGTFARGARARTTAAALAGASAILVAAPSVLPDVRIDASKPLVVEIANQGRVVFSKWNALSRIDVVERPGVDPMILIDSAAKTSIARPAGASGPYQRDISTLAYRVAQAPKVAIIGSGGGMDVQNALALGARHVTCVEINPIIIDLVTTRYREHVGAIFEDPRVSLVRDEGRSFIERTRDAFDVVQLTLIDTWAAGASGAYSLTENYLYTTDAFRAYLDRLTPDGMLAITRWYYEAPRLATLGRAALESMGVAEPQRCALVIERGISTAFLLKRRPFTPAEVASARAFAAEIGADVLYDPTRPGMESFYDVFFAQPDPAELLAAMPERLDPVGDDDPFFFLMARWSNIDLGALSRVPRSSTFLEPLVVPVGQIALAAALVVGAVLSVTLLAIALASRTVPHSGRWRWLTYFLGLGLAFIIVEVVLMQRFALFLGHPTYSVTVVLFAILLFSGLGSAWSGRRSGALAHVARPVAIALPIAIVFLTFVVPPLTSALIGMSLPIRLAIATLVIAPVAFCMGMPFPIGIRAAAAEDSGLVAWAWAANGCASVIGSVAAVLGAITWSFSVMLLVAGAIYVLALILLTRTPRALT